MNRLIFLSFMIFFLTFSAIKNTYAFIPAPGEKNTLPGDTRKKIFYMGLGLGMTSYYGDLVNNNLKAPFYYRYGIQISAEREIFPSTRLCVNFFGGNLLGDERTDNRIVNFKTAIIAPQAGLSFNFLNWVPNKKIRDRLSCYIYTGVEGIFFSTKGDLENAKDEVYHYWSDGSIRDLPENTPNQGSAQIISRDYIYETHYRNLDIDNAGKVKQLALGIPLGLSAEVRISKNVYLRAGLVLHYTFTDYLDNITENSVGSRKGNPGNDKFLFTDAAVFYRLPLHLKKYKYPIINDKIRAGRK
jgi:hypothetical protein